MTLVVYKLDSAGHEVWQYPAQVQERGSNYVRLVAFFNRDDKDLGYTVFKRGDRFIETYYSDRWYNVFAVYDRDDGAFKGWYCNVCRPAAITEASVRCDDLALDVWVSPSGQALTLDEDEFEALDLTSSERDHGLAAAAEIRRLAASGKLPR